jgi:hypothetical protein
MKVISFPFDVSRLECLNSAIPTSDIEAVNDLQLVVGSGIGDERKAIDTDDQSMNLPDPWAVRLECINGLYYWFNTIRFAPVRLKRTLPYVDHRNQRATIFPDRHSGVLSLVADIALRLLR